MEYDVVVNIVNINLIENLISWEKEVMLALLLEI